MGEVANPADKDHSLEYDVNLVLDVALGVDEDTICEVYELQHPQLRRIMAMESFKSQVENMKKELQKDGMSFRIKARLQAEEYLRTTFEMIHNPDIDPKVRKDLIEATVRWAGLDKPKSEGEGGGGGGFSVTINLGNAGEQGTTIEGEVKQ